jgi:hypothetical protein
MNDKREALAKEDQRQIKHEIMQYLSKTPLDVLRVLSLKPSRRDEEWADLFAKLHPTWLASAGFIEYAVDVAETHRCSTLDRVIQELIDARSVLAELGHFSGHLLHELETCLRPFREEDLSRAPAPAVESHHR